MVRTIWSPVRARTKHSPRWPSCSLHSRGQRSHWMRPSPRASLLAVGLIQDGQRSRDDEKNPRDVFDERLPQSPLTRHCYLLDWSHRGQARLVSSPSSKRTQLSVRLELLVDARAVPPSALSPARGRGLRFLREKQGQTASRNTLACSLA